MKLKYLLVCIMLLFNAGISTAYLLEDKTLPMTLPDGTPTISYPPTTDASFDISGLVNSIEANNENLNVLYWKIIVPEDTGNKWNFSVEFAESKPYALLEPISSETFTKLRPRLSAEGGINYAWVCCNVTKGDRLYTADATTNTTLRGTLTNLYNINYKVRMYACTNWTDNTCYAGFWQNYLVGASLKPNVYNRRAALHLDGTQIGYALETKNVSVSNVPEVMKVFFI